MQILIMLLMAIAIVIIPYLVGCFIKIDSKMPYEKKEWWRVWIGGFIMIVIAVLSILILSGLYSLAGWLITTYL